MPCPPARCALAGVGELADVAVLSSGQTIVTSSGTFRPVW